jgi:membrane protein
MYSFIPNTRVKLAPAVIGGVTAGVLWALVGKVFASVIAYSAQMVAIYTGFAIVLTALIWIYLNWLILLIGAQLSFYVQCPQYLPHGHEPVELSGSLFEHMGLSVMQLIGRDFAEGKRYWTSDRLAAALEVPSAALAPVLASLEAAGIIVATEQECWLPARTMDSIFLADILAAVRCTRPGRIAVSATATPAANALMLELEDAMRERLRSRTLADLVASK